LATSLETSDEERELAESIINLYTKHDLMHQYLEWAIVGEIKKSGNS